MDGKEGKTKSVSVVFLFDMAQNTGHSKGEMAESYE